MQVKRLGAGVFTIEDFLSPQECAAFIERSELIGYSEAAIRTENGDELLKDARNNDRIILDDFDLAASLYERAKQQLPNEEAGWAHCGFNERFRYYRYEKQQKFVWHLDGTVRKSPTVESVQTFMIYLNDDFTGGNTDFGWESVKPVQGMALVFPHRLRHQGSTVQEGVKYVLRTDVFYAKRDA